MLYKTDKALKSYTILWLVFTAAYLIWMCAFMRWDTYPPAETGIFRFGVFPAWIAVSAVLMLLYIVYIRVYLYGAVGKGAKAFALLSLLFGCAYVTWYCFLKNPLEYTASMIGLEYPWQFKIWGILAPASIFINTLYMYRKYNFHSRAGVIAGSIGCAAMFITINVPSAGEDLILTSLRCMSHWSGALIFAFSVATSILIFLVHMAKTHRLPFVLLCIFFFAVFAVCLTLLAVVGKDGIIEGVPTWATYVALFLVNFTSVFPLPDEQDNQKDSLST
ncbi:MAG: hypothetical protein ACI4I5_10360 [Acutalibacteraceae bacterium]